MSAKRFAEYARGNKPRLALFALAIAALGSAVGIEMLHGHACTADGCLLCLAATFAQGLLIASLGALIAQPIVRLVVKWRTTRTIPLPTLEPGFTLHSALNRRFATSTPVTMGVKLLI